MLVPCRESPISAQPFCSGDVSVRLDAEEAKFLFSTCTTADDKHRAMSYFSKFVLLNKTDQASFLAPGPRTRHSTHPQD